MKTLGCCLAMRRLRFGSHAVDQPLSYRSGTSVTTAKRLATITVEAGNSIVRTYRLTYS